MSRKLALAAGLAVLMTAGMASLVPVSAAEDAQADCCCCCCKGSESKDCGSGACPRKDAPDNPRH